CCTAESADARTGTACQLVVQSAWNRQTRECGTDATRRALRCGGVLRRLQCLQELEVALAALMHACQHRIDNTQPGSATDAPPRNPIAGTYPAVDDTTRLERAHHC